MNLVNYEVKTQNGTIFQTTNYAKAKECGNRIIRTFLTPVDPMTNEQKEKMRARRLHRQELLKAKRD